MKTRIISGFPGVGKTSFYNYIQGDIFNPKGIKCIDSDSSNFSWIRKGERNPHFPTNYINYIKRYIGHVDYILMSSHQEVRDALFEAKLEFYLIYPNEELMHEYLTRYKNRGDSDKFISFMAYKWRDFISECDNQKGCYNLCLGEGAYLIHILEHIESTDSVLKEDG